MQYESLCISLALLSEGQETGAIAPAPENSRKFFLRGVVDRARKNFFFCFENNHFIHFQLQNNAPICLQILSKVKLTLGNIIPVALKYLIFTMQNSSGGTPHRSDFL
jgi:hypothetical protein